MSESRSFSYVTPSGRSLHGLIDLPEMPGPHATLVDCHGFKGFMEWGFHPYLAALLAARGIAVVRLNLRSSGMMPGDELVTDEDAFAQTTVGEDVADIHAVLDALAAGEIADCKADPERLALLGHSRGGGVALLAAAAEPWSNRLKALVTWAGVGTFDRISKEDQVRWRQIGAMPVVNARTGQALRLDVSLLDDGEAQRDAYDLEAAARRRKAPWLLLHGKQDETVPVSEAHHLTAAAEGDFLQHLITTGNHTFGAQHPFVGPTPDLIEAMNATQSWLLKHLVGRG